MTIGQKQIRYGTEFEEHMERNSAARFWPEAGTLGALVVPQQQDVSTVLAWVIDELAVGDGKRIGVIQSGAEAEQLVTRIISARAAIPKNTLERGRLTSDQFVAMTEAAEIVNESVIYPLCIPAAKGTRVFEVAAQLCRSNNLDGFVIAQTPENAGVLADELHLLKRLAESDGLSVLLLFSEDGGGTGELPSNIATAFAWVERLKDME